MYILKKENITKENIEKRVRIYTNIKWIICVMLVISAVWLTSTFWIDNETFSGTGYLFLIFSIVCAYMFPVGNVELQMESFEDYKEILKYIAELNPNMGKQRYIDSLCIIKKSIENFEHRVLNNQINIKKQSDKNNIFMFFRKITQDKNYLGISIHFYNIYYAKRVANGLLNALIGKERVENVERYEDTEKFYGWKRAHYLLNLNPACIGNLILLAVIIFKMIVIIKGIDIEKANVVFKLINDTGTDIIALVLGIISMKKLN